jgi:hypothetical protein
MPTRPGVKKIENAAKTAIYAAPSRGVGTPGITATLNKRWIRPIAGNAIIDGYLHAASGTYCHKTPQA